MLLCPERFHQPLRRFHRHLPLHRGGLVLKRLPCGELQSNSGGSQRKAKIKSPPCAKGDVCASRQGDCSDNTTPPSASLTPPLAQGRLKKSLPCGKVRSNSPELSAEPTGDSVYRNFFVLPFSFPQVYFIKNSTNPFSLSAAHLYKMQKPSFFLFIFQKNLDRVWHSQYNRCRNEVQRCRWFLRRFLYYLFHSIFTGVYLWQQYRKCLAALFSTTR